MILVIGLIAVILAYLSFQFIKHKSDVLTRLDVIEKQNITAATIEDIYEIVDVKINTFDKKSQSTYKVDNTYVPQEKAKSIDQVIETKKEK